MDANQNFDALSAPASVYNLLFITEKYTNRAKEEKIQLPGCVPLLKMHVLELLV